MAEAPILCIFLNKNKYWIKEPFTNVFVGANISFPNNGKGSQICNEVLQNL